MPPPRKRIAVFMGTRPEAIKLAPVIAALRARPDVETTVVNTGQHEEMIEQVVRLFELQVDERLRVMQAGQTLATLTARLVLAVDELLERRAQDLALVQGDTTTALVASLACFYRKVPVGHVEAGLRTRDLMAPFPEEANRRMAAAIVALHFAPTETARENLLAEGHAAPAISVTGNTVIDALQLEVARQDDPAVARAIDAHLSALLGADWARVPMVLVTGHRRESFGEGFRGICEALRRVAARFPDHRVVYPVHLNPNVTRPVHDRLAGLPNVALVKPQEYRPFVALMRRARLLLTDSGGIQEEAPSLGKPVLVMRATTERPEGLAAGTVRLVGTDPDVIVAEVTRLLEDEAAYRAMATARNPYGDGHAAGRIVERCLSFLAAGDLPRRAG